MESPLTKKVTKTAFEKILGKKLTPKTWAVLQVFISQKNKERTCSNEKTPTKTIR